MLTLLNHSFPLDAIVSPFEELSYTLRSYWPLAIAILLVVIILIFIFKKINKK
ncbi:MAG: hypothetical protein IKK33_14085 [Lachnospiraceae bacterium]|nr:hypothetical protein [Lachnospiraceae bacterium]